LSETTVQPSQPKPELPAKQHAAKSKHLAKSTIAIPLFFVALPPILFYTVLFRIAVNIPLFDDYDALLNFLNQLAQVNGTSAKVSFFLASQHGEMKLFFLHGMACLQLYLCGHIDFRILSTIANGFVFLLAILLWKMFLPNCKDLAFRLAYFIPVSWLLFQFQYWANLDFSTPGLQHVAVLPFIFGTIYLLVRGRGLWAFLGASAFLILAVGSDGNALLLVPFGTMILALSRRYKLIAPWLLVSAGCIAAYAYRYNVMSSQTGPHRSIIAAFHPLAPAFVLSFIGSAAGFPFQSGSFVLGALLCVFFFYLARRGYTRRNPLVSYCVLFILITAVCVAGIRSDFGVFQAVSPRYAIYSALLLIFAWFAIVEEFLQNRPASLFKNDIFLSAMLAVFLFYLVVDSGGWLLIHRRQRALIQAMNAYEHPSPGSETGPSLPFGKGPLDPLTVAFNQRVRPILEESIRLGIYRPPVL